MSVGNDFRTALQVEPPDGRIYLNTAAEGLVPQAAGDALLRAYEAKRRGSRGRDSLYAGETACREAAARTVGATTEEVALVPNTSTGIERFVQSVRWQEGDEVLLNDLEFPSNVTPWLAARDRYGIRVRVLPTRDGILAPHDVVQAITNRTRVLSVSAVSFKSGGRVDLANLAEVARNHDVTFCVDATQSLGAVPLPTGAWDVLWCSGYKWLLGMHGVALMAVRDAVLERMTGGAPGWRSTPVPFPEHRFDRIDWSSDATRFHAGMPSFASAFVLHDSLKALQALGIDRIGAHITRLGERLLTGLKDLNIECLTPTEADRRAGIVAFDSDDFAPIGEHLSAQGIDVWAKDGRVRISFHAYTTEAEIDLCLRAMEETIASAR